MQVDASQFNVEAVKAQANFAGCPELLRIDLVAGQAKAKAVQYRALQACESHRGFEMYLALGFVDLHAHAWPASTGAGKWQRNVAINLTQ